MRRDHFTVVARELDSDADAPRLTVEYTGPTETLTTQLTDDGGELYPSEVIDAAFRLQDPLDGEDVAGVFSATHRMTGEYLLEVNVEAETILEVVRAARDSDDGDTSYHVRIHRRNDDPVTYEMDSLLFYDSDGDLVRQRSLIPSGVEL